MKLRILFTLIATCTLTSLNAMNSQDKQLAEYRDQQRTQWQTQQQQQQASMDCQQETAEESTAMDIVQDSPLLSLPNEKICEIIIFVVAPTFTQNNWMNNTSFDPMKLVCAIKAKLENSQQDIKEALFMCALTCKQLHGISHYMLPIIKLTYETCILPKALHFALKIHGTSLCDIVVTYHKRTSLHIAANEDTFKIAQALLISAGTEAEDLLFQKDSYEKTALHKAAFCGSINSVNFLLDYAGKRAQELVFLADSDGTTALYNACSTSQDNNRIVVLLLEEAQEKRNELLFHKDYGLRTALHEAARNGNVLSVIVMLFHAETKAGELMMLKDIYNKTALDYAQKNYSTRVIALLEAAYAAYGQDENNDRLLNFLSNV
jgi:ankyrin repeat protein